MHLFPANNNDSVNVNVNNSLLFKIKNRNTLSQSQSQRSGFQFLDQNQSQSDYDYRNDDNKSIKLSDIISVQQFQNLYKDAIVKQHNQDQSHNLPQQQSSKTSNHKLNNKIGYDFELQKPTDNRFWKTNTYVETLIKLSQKKQSQNNQNLNYYQQLKKWQSSQKQDLNKMQSNNSNKSNINHNSTNQKQKQSQFIIDKKSNAKRSSQLNQIKINQRFQKEKYYQDTSYIQQLERLSIQDKEIREKDYMRSHMRVIQNQYKKKIRELVDNYDNKNNQNNDLNIDLNSKNPSNNILINPSFQALNNFNNSNNLPQSNPPNNNLIQVDQYQQLKQKMLSKLSANQSEKQLAQAYTQTQRVKNQNSQLDSISFQHLISRPPTYTYQKSNDLKKDIKNKSQKDQDKTSINQNLSHQMQIQEALLRQQKIKKQLKQLYANAYYPFQNHKTSHKQSSRYEKQKQKSSLESSGVKKSYSYQSKVKLNIQKLLKLSAKEFLLFYSQNYRKIVNLCSPEELTKLNNYRQKCLDKQSSIQKLQKMIRQKGESFIKKLSHQQRQKLFQVLYENYEQQQQQFSQQYD